MMKALGAWLPSCLPFRLSAWLSACLLVCLAAALPAAQAAPARSLRFEQLTVDQGLAQETVLAVVQDGQGFIWIGSQAGLSRYDGYRVTTYRNAANDPGSLVNNWVQALHVDPAGRLWVGTDGGLDLFDPASRSFRHFFPHESLKRGNGNRHVRAIADDGAAGLWIASGDGLQHFDPAGGTFTALHHHDAADAASLSDDQVNAIALDAGGRLWVGTTSGLDSLASGARSFTHHRVEGGELQYNAVQTLLVDAAQTLWIGSLVGLERWQIGAPAASRQRFGAAEGLRPGRITALLQDADANLWVGSHDDGLFRWQPNEGRFANYRHLSGDSHSVADNQISALYRDRVGTFWVGTWYAGASRVDLNSGGFSRLAGKSDNPAAAADNKVRAILDDGAGKLWLATNGGLSRLDPADGAAKVWRHDPADPASLAAPTASALARDLHGVLWVGGSAGLSRLDGASGRFARVALGTSVDGNSVRGMLADRSGQLWISTRGGLHSFDPLSGALKTFRHDPADSASLADNIVRPLLEDRHGRLWVGTFDGLDLLDRASGKFRHYRHDPKDPTSLSNDEVHHLMEDRAGTLWVGTAAGLNRALPQADGSLRFQRYTTKDGMADDAIAAVLEDGAGQLWVSTNSGIARFDPASGRWRNYGAADGTIEGAYFDAAALRGPDGSMYFGGFNGVTVFDPRAISENLFGPRAIVTGFQIFNKPAAQVHPGLFAGPIESAAEVVLGAADAMFSLEFSALHFAAPQRNVFAYQLEGFDETWVQTDAGKRYATYTNLDPGSYVFRVRAANKDGVWGPLSPGLRIVIAPPWYKTWWLRSLALLAALGGTYAAYRARMDALGRQKLLLEQQVGARTREIAEQNHLLEHQTRQLELQRHDAEQRRAQAERQTEEVERQKENVERAHRNISILSEIGREMAATLDMETIMSTVYRHVHHLMNARTFGIGFVREDLGVIEFPYSIDLGERSKVYVRRMDDPDQFAVWCVENRREIFINDLEAEYDSYISRAGVERLAVAPRPDGSAAMLPGSIMYVPLIVNERVMGVLCVQCVDKNAYRRVHLDMLQTLAAHAAVALDNARAYTQLEQTQARLVEQERQVRQNTEQLALANRALQENDERLRLAKQRAEDATRQKSEFLANMSHEMRTPLAGVIGMLGFALRDARLQAGTREQILRGQANAQSLLTIINDLLDFSKIEAGKLSIENIDFALGAAIENVVSLFEEQAAARSVGFGVTLADDLPPFVVGDPTRLRQVLVNLVGNAFKFTHAGMVSVTVARDESDGAGPLNRIRFSVRDSGIGIPADAIERLFEQFEQADSTTTRRYGGTGLGLAICRQLVGLMGGSIHADSIEGVGSTFSFVLPLADGVAPPLAPHVPRTPHSHRLQVLCAEDFATNQIIIRMMLEELGHQVDIAENGALAVAACARKRYDLILMDGRMPEMDGASATRLIRAGGPPEAPVCDGQLMIVALTANASEEDRSRYLACGMDDFLTKPIDEAALHLQLSRAIARQLQRGIALPAMPASDEPPAMPAPDELPAMPAPDERTPSTAELDAMFGVLAGPAPPERNAGRRGSDLKARLRAVFADDLPARSFELEAAIARRDGDGAGRLLHGIKGSAAHLDAHDLQQLCGEMEAAADAARWEQIGVALPRLRALLAGFGAAPA